MGMISKMDNTQPQVDEQEPCNWCNGPMPPKATPLAPGPRWAPFCSRKCAEADARDARETEADKWAMRYEM